MAASPVRIVAVTVMALVAFAANSLLCRAALRGDAIDAASFTAIRLGTGAVMLGVISGVLSRRESATSPSRGSWRSAIALSAYAIGFSAAYLEMGAGTGALILFGAVQITMIGAGLIRGERPTAVQWAGIAIAIAGLASITAPSLDAPPIGAAGLMAGAGVAWGIYSLRGRGVTGPLAATAGNFARSIPIAAVIAGVGIAAGPHLSSTGVALAATSGALASGVGYSLWYAAIPTLGATRAAVIQLSVPVIAAAGAIPVLGEPLTLVLALGGAAVLGGLALVLAGTRRPAA